MDSVPMVAITGQVGTDAVGTDAFQEADIVGITLPVVKHSYLVKDADDLPQSSGGLPHRPDRPPRPGARRHPRGLRGQTSTTSRADPPMIPGYQPPDGAGHPKQIAAAAKASAQRQAPDDLRRRRRDHQRRRIGGAAPGLSELTELPVTHDPDGPGRLPGDHPLCIGMLGMHGIAAANYAIQESDLILAVGVRFDERVTGNRHERVGPGAKIIHIDVDPAEISKNAPAHIAIAGEAKPRSPRSPTHTGAARAPRRRPRRRVGADRRLEARATRYELDERHRRRDPAAARGRRRCTASPDGDAIVRTDVGQHQMWAAQHYLFDQPRRWITSGGLGHDGLRPARRDRRPGRAARRAGRRHRRRRLASR